MNRIKMVSAHVCAAGESGQGPQMDSAADVWNSGSRMDKFFQSLDKQLPKDGEYDVSQHLPGPLGDVKRYPNGWLDAFKDLDQWQKKGAVHAKFAEWQREYGGSLSANIVVPYLIFKRSDGDEGNRVPPTITHEVIIADAQDARRIGRVHVKKQPNFNLFFYGSVISTIDNEYWKMQREQLVPGFLPTASLAQIFDISSDRARFCSQRLRKLMEEGKGVVDMNEFLLYETQAQLQLALFGETNEFMEETNEKFRQAMSGSYDPNYVRPLCKAMAERMDSPDRFGPALREDVAAGKCPMAKGPLSVQLRTMEGVAPHTREGNTLLALFAGHDTTGHTMTWLLFELAKNPDCQMRLQQEVDAFFAKVGDRKIVYEDLKDLPYMTRCVMETLRLWPAVANGTFREIQFDDYINGPDGKEVLIKKGTYVRIVNWSRHRNPEYWGPDANSFNPDREWKDEEVWYNEGFRAYNPASDRFSPFAFPPRSCIGMNFAHLEMRLIVACILRDFSFELEPSFRERYLAQASEYVGVNYGTLAPRDLTQPDLINGFAGWAPQVKVPSGLPMRVVPRSKRS